VGEHHHHGHGHTAVVAAPTSETSDVGVSPLLDIGDGVGAFVVYLPGQTRTGELEACPAGRPAEHFHTGVHPRRVGGGTVWAAVFPQVAQGSYQVLDDDGIPMALLQVTGGHVAEVDLRSP
jgi:hypothetical protein